MATLDRVTDPAALDAHEGARARLCVDVPADWLTSGAIVELTAPARLPCARCEGGGCDGCGRSGVLRAPAEAAARVVRAVVPAQREAPGALALRIPEPFGPACAIAQLIVELRPAAEAGAGVRRVPEPPAEALPGPPLRLQPLAVATLVAVIAALVALLSR